MDLKLQILGSSSAIPTAGRHPTSQFLTIANHHFLIDCGEGTQTQLRRNRIGFGRIDHILISHLHGDHFYGLVPLLTSLHLLDRHREIHLYGPEELELAVKQILKITGSQLRFPLIFHVTSTTERKLIFEDERLKVYSFPLNHSMPCCGFFFEEQPRPRNMRKDMLQRYNIPVAEIRQIKKGADWISEEGQRISNAELTYQPKDSLSYAFCTDTAPVEDLPHLFPTRPNLMYHEATFMQQHLARARKTKHSTAKQAAEIALKCDAGHLLLGHFSVRYDDLEPLLMEAKSVFSQSYLARENSSFFMHDPSALRIELPQ